MQLSILKRIYASVVLRISEELAKIMLKGKILNWQGYEFFAVKVTTKSQQHRN